MFDEVLPPLLVLLLEPVLALVLDEEEGEDDAEGTAACGDDEGVALAEGVYGGQVGSDSSRGRESREARMASTGIRQGGGKELGSGVGVVERRRTLNWGEALGADRRSGLAEGGGETVASTPDRSGVRFRRDCPLHVTGALWGIRMSRRTTSPQGNHVVLVPRQTGRVNSQSCRCSASSRT